MPDDVHLDGVDLGETLRGGAAPAPRRIYLQWHRGNTPERYRNYAVVTMQHKLYRSEPNKPDELYDLYHRELDVIEDDLVSLLALRDRAPVELLRQRDVWRASSSDWLIVGGAALVFLLALILPVVALVAFISWAVS